MKTSQRIILLMTIGYCLACSKTDTPAPTTPTTTPTPATSMACRIESDLGLETDAENLKFTYDTDGFISGIQLSVTDSRMTPITYICAYRSGLLSTIRSPGFEEIHIYTNGVLSKIQLPGVGGAATYNIDIETDAQKRIVKMTDTNNLQSVLKRDATGNLIEVIVTNLTDKKVVNRIVQSDFDGKKSIYELYKGWQFDAIQDYTTYMKAPLFTVGAGGNPRKVQVYLGTSLVEDWEHTYQYNLDGYPTKRTSLNKSLNRTFTHEMTYKNCK
jgi:hypothetical protein